MQQAIIKAASSDSRPYGLVSLNGEKYFYKRLETSAYMRELDGHRYLRDWYPVAKLLAYELITPTTGILVYEYEKTIGHNRGLLTDLLAIGQVNSPEVTAILSMYRSAFTRSLHQGLSTSSRVFFEDRIPSRINRFYAQQSLEHLEGREITINGEFVTLHPARIISQLSHFFAQPRETWCVASQCDPNDLNITTKPLLLDYLGGGPTPVAAELAVLFWYCLAMGNYFAPRYHTDAYDDHNLGLGALDQVTWDGSTLVHTPEISRMSFFERYLQEVICPLFGSADFYDNWYNDFKHYLTMRILGVFNVSDMSETDQLLSWAYVELYFKQDLKHVTELSQKVLTA